MNEWARRPECTQLIRAPQTGVRTANLQLGIVPPTAKGLRGDKIIMIFRLNLLWLLAAGIAGCASPPSVHQLANSQHRTEQMLVQQAERLELQRQQLLALQEERSEILQELAGLRRQLAQLYDTRITPPVDPPTASASEASNSDKSPSTRSRPLTDASGKVILGREEWVWFDLLGRSVRTRLDTGVRSSLIYTSDVQLFERDGDQWVRFELNYVASDGQVSAQQVYESPLLRRIRMRSANGGEGESRPIVKLKIQLGELVDDSEFILVRRENNEFPVVLGRSFLRDIAVVDVARRYTQDKKPENPSL